MEMRPAQVDLYLTEISIELLGNKIYDINGGRQDKLLNLFMALPEHQNKSGKNDLICSLGYHDNFTQSETSLKDFLDQQFDFILQDANNSKKTKADIVAFLRKYKLEQRKVIQDAKDMNLKRIIERGKLVTRLNRKRLTALHGHKLNVDRQESVAKYYEHEKDSLLKMSTGTLRLMKYIINDSRNEEKKGELIGFAHALRSVKDGNLIKRSKPYARMLHKTKRQGPIAE